MIIFIALLAAHGQGLSVGRVVEFSPKGAGRLSLGAVTATDGKKFSVVDAEGRTMSVPKSAIKHEVANSCAACAEDVRKFADEANRIVETLSAVDDTTIDDAWELVSEDAGPGESVSLAELCDLVVGEGGCAALYATHVLLGCSVAGRARFKTGAGGDGFSPRSAAESTRLLAQLRAEASAEAAAELEASTLVARFRAAMASGQFDVAAESDATRRKLESVARLGCRAGLAAADEGNVAEPTDAEANAFLKVLEFKATADSAKTLLVRLGVWDQHENLEIIRSRTPTRFTDALERAALALASASRRLAIYNSRWCSRVCRRRVSRLECTIESVLESHVTCARVRWNDRS